MFYHGWNAYEMNAFPADELRPLTCDGMIRDQSDPSNIGRNDVLGNYSLTLVDSLDMFAILEDCDKFEQYVSLVKETVNFDKNSTVQVFETTIRGMGGLLSAHLFASVPGLGCHFDDYNGELLDLAYDLGLRLLPAFDQTSGLPAPRVHLQNGMDLPTEIESITETCASGAGSLLLEFGMLSRLTGDKRFDHLARQAFFELYRRRSDLDMIAMAIDSQSGFWQAPMTGTGASIDSFYEYALKYAVLFNDNDFLNIFNNLYHAIKAHGFNGWAFRNIHFERAHMLTTWIDSLSAFYTSIMVLMGDLESAIRNHLTFYKIWTAFAGLPERWSFHPRKRRYYPEEDPVVLEWYPLRPEFAESNWYLYRATNDPLFLEIGQTIMTDLQNYNKVPCGYAGTQDVRTGELSNRMESFFLSETAKYLYLLFNQSSPLNYDHSNWVFSTEAHPFWYDKNIAEYAYKSMTDLGTQSFISSTGYKQSQAGFFNFFSNLLNRISDFADSLLQPRAIYNRNVDEHNTHRMRNQSVSSSYTLPSFSFDQQCEPYRNGLNDGVNGLNNKLFSPIASWDMFYQLDSFYNFTKPANMPKRRGLEYSKFYDRHVDPQATCRANSLTDEDSMDLLISIPKGGRRGSVLYRHDSGDIEATSLLGMRMKLHKSHADHSLKGKRVGEPISYSVTMLNGIKVPETLLVQEMLLQSDDSLTMSGPDLFFNGIKIQNIKVINKH